MKFGFNEYLLFGLKQPFLKDKVTSNFTISIMQVPVFKRQIISIKHVAMDILNLFEQGYTEENIVVIDGPVDNRD